MLAIAQRALSEPKLLKFGAVSAFNIVCHQTVLALGQQVWDLEPTIANIVAASVTAVPSFFLARYWVWQGSDGSMRTQATWFWLIALLGMAVSTGVVWLSEKAFDGWLFVQAASFLGYLIVWVLKFFFLDRVFTNNAVEESTL